MRRELEEAAKVLGERIRTNEATCEVRGPLSLRFRQQLAALATCCSRTVFPRKLVEAGASYCC